MCENTIKFDRFFKQWFGHLSYVNLNCNTFKWLSTLAHWHQSLVLAFSKNAGGNVPSITSKINNDWLMPGKFVRIAWANTITSPTSSWCHWQGRRTRLGCVFGMGASIALGLTVFHIVTFSIFHLAMFTPLLHLVSLQCLLYFSCYMSLVTIPCLYLHFISSLLAILYHLIQFGSHASRGLSNRRNVMLVTAIFIRCWNHFVIWLSNIEIFCCLRLKTAENLQMSRWVWEVAESKTSSDVSHITWGAELN